MTNKLSGRRRQLTNARWHIDWRADADYLIICGCCIFVGAGYFRRIWGRP
jgi:hypothetical protein